MKLLIIRHGEPDYAHDTLTEKGWREALYLAERIAPLDVKQYYVSPLGRAQDTARPTLEKAGRTAVTLDWLREFTGFIRRPDRPDRDSIAWDWLPQDWTADERFFSDRLWAENEVMQAGGVRTADARCQPVPGGVGAVYEQVVRSFDELLARHGYLREGRLYRAVQPSNDTLVFFCHFALECVLLSHLLNVSPMVLWHGLCAAPSSVTTVATEERRPGVASFRVLQFGDISHLYAHGEPPSFMARFCECYGNEGQRPD